MTQFKPGDIVIKKSGGQPFKVHISHIDGEYVNSVVGVREFEVLFDVYLNKVRAENCMLLEVYNSPLMRALSERG